MNVPLDGIWLAPVFAQRLGSHPPRPAQEASRSSQGVPRGHDLFDPKDVGFDSFSDEAKKIGTGYDVSQKSNGNAGHVFGTDLPEDQKDALVEYLKKL